MNVFLHKQKLFQILLLFGLPVMAWAQETVRDTIYEAPGYSSVTAQIDFTSEPNDPTLLSQPEFGTVSWIETEPFHYTLTYRREDGALGSDNFRVLVWKKQPNTSVFTYEQVNFHISVQPSAVAAHPDQATTTTGEEVFIDVLANDFTTTGNIHIKNIPLVNNGTADFVSGSPQIRFTPAPGFQGIAYLNYVVCDNAGACDRGTVIVNVLGEEGHIPDTTVLFTERGQELPVFVPQEYLLVQSPENGTYDQSGFIASYQPQQGFTGGDYLVFEYNGMSKVIQVEVLDFEDNTFAVDDEVYITPFDGETEFNVLANDGYGNSASCVNLQQGAQYGTVSYTPQTDGRGVFRYTPPAGFTGVDWFTYSSCPPGGAGDSEIAKVYVYVSEYEPSLTNFQMSTPKKTPLIVGYSVPIQTYNFEIVESGSMGQTQFLEGHVDTLIFGQQVKGYNLVIYIPNEGVEQGNDEIELTYCVRANGSCAFQKTVKIDIEILNVGDGESPMCFDDCIWSGDTNFDGVVNMEDLLPIGLATGEVGHPRSDVNFDVWYGQYGDDWEGPVEVLPIDLKHLDTDGDSVITALDTVAISQFYGRAHSMTAVKMPYYEDEIVLSGNIFVSPGDLVELPMLLGTPNDPAENIYGFTFPFNYNPDFVVPGSVAIDFESNSWLTYNSAVLHMQRDDQAGRLDAAFTRTNAIATSGHGRIGTVRFIISDDLDGFRDDDNELALQVGGGTSTVMNGAGQSFGMNVSGATVHILFDEEDEAQPLDQHLLKLYPNPSNRDFINVHMNGQRDLQKVVVYDLTGRVLYDTEAVFGNRMQVPLTNFQNGMYVLSAFTKDGVVNKKFQVLR
ncbi:Ig-like domain-containing protein [Phaeodactylibacter luteus]|nr:Ig-like domain-containing protein [Phaeodactylibacter luteus]